MYYTQLVFEKTLMAFFFCRATGSLANNFGDTGHNERCGGYASSIILRVQNLNEGGRKVFRVDKYCTTRERP